MKDGGLQLFTLHIQAFWTLFVMVKDPDSDFFESFPVKRLLNIIRSEGGSCLQGNQVVINLYNRYSGSNDFSTHSHLFLAPATRNMEPLLFLKFASLES